MNLIEALKYDHENISPKERTIKNLDRLKKLIDDLPI